MALLLLPIAGKAQQRLQVGYLNFPPYEYSDHGRPRGPLIDILSKVADEAGFRLEFRLLKPQQLYRYLRDGSVDVWPGLTGVPDLQSYIYESRHTLMHLRLSAYAIAPTAPVTSLDELSGSRLIFIEGYTYSGLGRMLRQRARHNTVIPASTQQAALQMLAKGQADYLIDYQRPVETALRSMTITGLRASPLSERSAAFIVSRKIPHAWDLMEKLDRTYAELLQKGVIKPENQ